MLVLRPGAAVSPVALAVALAGLAHAGELVQGDIVEAGDPTAWLAAETTPYALSGLATAARHTEPCTDKRMEPDGAWPMSLGGYARLPGEGAPLVAVDSARADCLYLYREAGRVFEAVPLPFDAVFATLPGASPDVDAMFEESVTWRGRFAAAADVQSVLVLPPAGLPSDLDAHAAVARLVLLGSGNPTTLPAFGQTGRTDDAAPPLDRPGALFAVSVNVDEKGHPVGGAVAWPLWAWQLGALDEAAAALRLPGGRSRYDDRTVAPLDQLGFEAPAVPGAPPPGSRPLSTLSPEALLDPNDLWPVLPVGVTDLSRVSIRATSLQRAMTEQQASRERGTTERATVLLAPGRADRMLWYLGDTRDWPLLTSMNPPDRTAMPPIPGDPGVPRCGAPGRATSGPHAPDWGVVLQQNGSHVDQLAATPQADAVDWETVPGASADATGFAVRVGTAGALDPRHLVSALERIPSDPADDRSTRLLRLLRTLSVARGQALERLRPEDAARRAGDTYVPGQVPPLTVLAAHGSDGWVQRWSLSVNAATVGRHEVWLGLGAPVHHAEDGWRAVLLSLPVEAFAPAPDAETQLRRTGNCLRVLHFTQHWRLYEPLLVRWDTERSPDAVAAGRAWGRELRQAAADERDTREAALLEKAETFALGPDLRAAADWRAGAGTVTLASTAVEIETREARQAQRRRAEEAEELARRIATSSLVAERAAIEDDWAKARALAEGAGHPREVARAVVPFWTEDLFRFLYRDAPTEAPDAARTDALGTCPTPGADGVRRVACAAALLARLEWAPPPDAAPALIDDRDRLDRQVRRIRAFIRRTRHLRHIGLGVRADRVQDEQRRVRGAGGPPPWAGRSTQIRVQPQVGALLSLQALPGAAAAAGAAAPEAKDAPVERRTCRLPADPTAFAPPWPDTVDLVARGDGRMDVVADLPERLVAVDHRVRSWSPDPADVAEEAAHAARVGAPFQPPGDVAYFSMYWLVSHRAWAEAGRPAALAGRIGDVVVRTFRVDPEAFEPCVEIRPAWLVDHEPLVVETSAGMQDLLRFEAERFRKLNGLLTASMWESRWLHRVDGTHSVPRTALTSEATQALDVQARLQEQHRWPASDVGLASGLAVEMIDPDNVLVVATGGTPYDLRALGVPVPYAFVEIPVQPDLAFLRSRPPRPLVLQARLPWLYTPAMVPDQHAWLERSSPGTARCEYDVPPVQTGVGTAWFGADPCRFLTGDLQFDPDTGLLLLSTQDPLPRHVDDQADEHRTAPRWRTYMATLDRMWFSPLAAIARPDADDPTVRPRLRRDVTADGVTIVGIQHALETGEEDPRSAFHWLLPGAVVTDTERQRDAPCLDPSDPRCHL